MVTRTETLSQAVAPHAVLANRQYCSQRCHTIGQVLVPMMRNRHAAKQQQQVRLRSDQSTVMNCCCCKGQLLSVQVVAAVSVGCQCGQTTIATTVGRGLCQYLPVPANYLAAANNYAKMNCSRMRPCSGAGPFPTVEKAFAQLTYPEQMQMVCQHGAVSVPICRFAMTTRQVHLMSSCCCSLCPRSPVAAEACAPRRGIETATATAGHPQRSGPNGELHCGCQPHSAAASRIGQTMAEDSQKHSNPSRCDGHCTHDAEMCCGLELAAPSLASLQLSNGVPTTSSMAVQMQGPDHTWLQRAVAVA